MDSSGRCPHFFNSCGEPMQSKLDSPMPWIGMYIAAASAIISTAMAVDVFYYGFKYKKLWLPSKCFSLNALYLTILAVAMKLPVDLTNQMLGVNEILARISSLALMSTVMGNLMTSLGTMEFNDMWLNVVALATLVITIIVNVFIHISKMVDIAKKEFRQAVISHIYVEQIICTVFMFILLVMLCSWGVAVPTLRRIVDKEHSRLNEKDSTKQVKWGSFTIDGLRAVLRDYWVNAKIGNPQFLVARSEISAASGAICLLTALTLLEAWLRLHFAYDAGVKVDASNYRWSINWILIVQTVGVGLGTVAPMLRWFFAAKLKSSKIHKYCFIELFESSTLWGSSELLEWAYAHPSLKIRNIVLRCLVRLAKLILLLFCLIVLLVIALVSGLLLIVSAVFVKIILLPFPHDESIEEIESAWFAFREGVGLTPDGVKSICGEVDKLIEIAEKKQPENLIKLLKKSAGDFNGVREFIEQPISEPDDALNSWSLSIVILTCIAIQLPNILPAKIDALLRGVTEGLHYVNLVEKSLNVILERHKFRLDAADLWRELRAFGSCYHIRIRKGTYEETTQVLKDLARNVSSEISSSRSGYAYSQNMTTRSIGYISSAIVRYTTDNPEKTEADLFERISVMTADLLSACLTNLVPLTTFMCTNSAIEEREENVREAATVLGQTREILEMLRGRRLPGLDPEKAAHLHEWRSFIEHNPNWIASM